MSGAADAFALTCSAPEELVGGVVGWMGSDVIFQAVETTVIQRPEEVSGCSQHHPPVTQVPVLSQPREKCQLDVIQRLKEVKHLGEKTQVLRSKLFSIRLSSVVVLLFDKAILLLNHEQDLENSWHCGVFFSLQTDWISLLVTT